MLWISKVMCGCDAMNFQSDVPEWCYEFPKKCARVILLISKVMYGSNAVNIQSNVQEWCCEFPKKCTGVMLWISKVMYGSDAVNFQSNVWEWCYEFPKKGARVMLCISKVMYGSDAVNFITHEFHVLIIKNNTEYSLVWKLVKIQNQDIASQEAEFIFTFLHMKQSSYSHFFMWSRVHIHISSCEAEFIFTFLHVKQSSYSREQSSYSHFLHVNRVHIYISSCEAEFIFTFLGSFHVKQNSSNDLFMWSTEFSFTLFHVKQFVFTFLHVNEPISYSHLFSTCSASAHNLASYEVLLNPSEFFVYFKLRC